MQIIWAKICNVVNSAGSVLYLPTCELMKQ